MKLTYFDGMAVAYEACLREKLICIILVIGGGRRGLVYGCRRFLVIYLYREIEALAFDSVDDDSDNNDRVPKERKFETGGFGGIGGV